MYLMLNVFLFNKKKRKMMILFDQENLLFDIFSVLLPLEPAGDSASIVGNKS